MLTTLKILLIGETSTGKSCLLLRFYENVFDEFLSSTIGFDHKSKTITVCNQSVKLSLWDTAGSERFRTLTASYYRDAHGAVLVYDITNRESFEKLNLWQKELDMYTTHGNIVRMLVGNKVDKESERKVTKEEGIQYARRHQMLFVETSARTSENVVDCFEELVAKILQTPDLWERRKDSIRLKTSNESSAFSYCSYC